MQASYTDLIIIVSAISYCPVMPLKSLPSKNKWEHVSERALDIMIDHLNTLNDLTPKIRTEGRNGVDPDLIFGLDSKLYLEQDSQQPTHHDEVETVTIYKGSSAITHEHKHEHVDEAHEACSHPAHKGPSQPIEHTNGQFVFPVANETLQAALGTLSKETIWRVKGFVRTERGLQILNWAFGRYELTDVEDIDTMSAGDVLKLTVMGERGEVKRAGRKLAAALGGMMQ